MSPTAVLDKATLPDCRLGPFFSRWLSACSAFSVFQLHFCYFPVFLQHARVDPHVPHSLWIEYEQNSGDWLCQGWVGCNS